MTNNDIYTLKLNRLELCDLMLACTNIVWQSIDEMKNDPECPEYRREHVLPEAIKKWQALHDEIKAQLEAQDFFMEEGTIVQGSLGI